MYLCLKKFSFQSAPDISSATQIQAYRPDEPSVCNLCQQGKIYRCINFGHIQKMIPFHNMLDKIWKHTVKKFLIVTHVWMIGPLAKEKPAEGAVTFIWLLQKVPLLVRTVWTIRLTVNIHQAAISNPSSMMQTRLVLSYCLIRKGNWFWRENLNYCKWANFGNNN